MSPVTTNPIPTMVSGWAEWGTVLYPPQGLEDMVTRPDGYISSSPMGHQNATHHLRQQYILMRSVYFPEYPHPLLQATETMVRAQYKKMSDHIASITAPRSKALSDFSLRWPPHGVLNPPSSLEPI